MLLSRVVASKRVKTIYIIRIITDQTDCLRVATVFLIGMSVLVEKRNIVMTTETKTKTIDWAVRVKTGGALLIDLEPVSDARDCKTE